MTDRSRNNNYRDGRNLAKRQAMYDFIDASRSTRTPLLDRFSWVGTEKVLDAGCGNGLWLSALRTDKQVMAVGLDISEGILRDARTRTGNEVPVLAGDVQALPFTDGVFDTVLALWMMYHVEEHLVALREFHRVLRDDGALLITTNSNV